MGRPAFVWSPFTIPPMPSMSLMMWTRTARNLTGIPRSRDRHSNVRGTSIEGWTSPRARFTTRKRGEGHNLRRPVISEDGSPGPAGLHLEIVAFERADPFSQPVGNRARLPLDEIDVDDRLVCGRHEEVVVDPVDLCFEGHARQADSCDPDEQLE